VKQVHEIDRLEPAVVLDVCRPVLKGPLAFGQVCSNQVLYETLAVRWEIPWELDFALHDLGLDFHRIVRVEWVYPVDHFLDEDP